jgi:hypothetical protein
MDRAGYWVEPGPGYNPKYRSTVWAISLLAQLGARVEEDKRIAQACHYLLEHALAEGGQFTTSGAPSGTADCLQGNLAWALLELGYDDPRLEKAFDWMARSVTGEKALLLLQTVKRLCVTMLASADRPLRAGPTIDCPVLGEASR